MEKELKDYVKPVLTTHGNIKKITEASDVTNIDDDDFGSTSHW